jgi:hypothetical protein
MIKYGSKPYIEKNGLLLVEVWGIELYANVT